MRDRRDAVTNAAKVIGRTSSYLRNRGAAGMVRDTEKLLLRSPEGSLAAAAAAGLIIGTILRNRR